MTAFNTSFVSSPAFAASRADKKVASSSKSNNYLVDVVDFDNEVSRFEVEAESASEASEQAEENCDFRRYASELLQCVSH